MKKSRLRTITTTFLSALLVIAVTVTGAQAQTPTTPPTITNTKASVLDGGVYQWEWSVGHGSKPALSNLVMLDLCDEVIADIVQGSIFGGTGHELIADGLKFEFGGDDFDVSTIGFSTGHDWFREFGSVVFKSGQLTYHQEVLMPDCETSVVPEPASMSLLAVGAIGLIARRRRKNAQASNG